MRSLNLLLILLFACLLSKGNLTIPDSIVTKYNILKNDSNKAEYLINKALTLQGNYPKLAFELAEKALFYSEQANYIQGMCKSYNILGSIKCNVGEYVTAIEYHEKAFERAKFINDFLLLSETYNYMGNVAYAQKKYSKAIEYYKESLQYSEKLKSKTQSLNNLYKLGLIYETLDNLNDAYRCYKRSLLIEEELKNKEGMFYSLMGIASVSMKKENFYQAYVLYNKAKDIAKELNILSYQSLVYSKLGDLAKAQKKYVEALNNYMIALKIADSLEYYKDKRDCYYNLAYTNEKLQYYKEAYNNLYRFVEINDTLYNAEVNEQIARMQMRFDIKAKEKEIEFFKQKEEQRTKERNFMIVGSIFLLIILVLLFLLYKNRQKHAQKLKAQYNEIKEKQDELNTAIEQLNQLNYELKKSNDEITDSLLYASTLQQMLLPFEQQFKQYFHESFVFNQPKHLVSGDFAWIYETNHYYYFAVADCTGHGLAGALVSIKASSLLNNYIFTHHQASTGEILSWLNENWNPKHHRKTTNEQEDSLEISLCRLNKQNLEMQYSTTNHKIVIVHQTGESSILNNNMFCIGGNFNNNEPIHFNTDQINLKTEDTIYLFTDGFADQFCNGNQKLMFNAFLEQLKSLSKYPIHQQETILKNFFIEWKGKNHQTDDVLVIGIRI